VSKKDDGKYEPTLVYRSLIDAVARVRKYGIEKYGKSEDWRTTPSVKHFDALLRHVYAYLSGEHLDEGSGLPHLWHAAANIMFEIERRARRPTNAEQDFVKVTCSRCKVTGDYPLDCVAPCAGGCGDIIEPALELKLAARDDLCVICHKNHVDSSQGFDTCDECLSKF
jgi:hypothetical protein